MSEQTSVLPLIGPQSSLKEAMAEIDRTARGIAVVVDSQGRLVGTVTDGDLRRAVLSSLPMTTPVQQLLEIKRGSSYGKPVSAPVGSDPVLLLELMRQSSVRQIPLIDCDERVVDLVLMDDLLPSERVQLQAVVMAGGFGTRLRPLTEDLPKPMLPVAGQPLMERIIKSLQQAGIRNVNVTTHYKPEKIREHFGDGESFGVELRYVNEDLPLGTAGALSLMSEPTEPLLVINGDILTSVNFRALLEYHREQRADMTVAVRRYEFEVPYGVIESDEGFVHKLSEKPTIGFFVNAGMYLLEPSVCRLIPSGQKFDMTDLIQALLDSGRRVASFAVREYWLDVGRHADYLRAQEDVPKPGEK